MTEILKIYHGSENIIKNPRLELGKINNDYGQGFYCTEDKNLAGEWACQNNKTGYANCYNIETSDLKILYLDDKKYNILHWITLLLENRTFTKTDILLEAKSFLLKNYHIDTSQFDIIKGYRADDSYFTFAKRFLNNGMSIQALEKAMKLGRLGQQIMIKSQKAFSKLEFQTAEIVDKNVYYPLFKKRDTDARNDYRKLTSVPQINELFLIDIMRNPHLFQEYLDEQNSVSHSQPPQSRKNYDNGWER